MYHFTADHPPEPVRLSFRALVPGHIRQYLKDFQIDAIRFMHNYLAKGEFCVYNDESGLGKQASVAVLLEAACSSKKSLIVVQNDDRYVNGWEFHFNVLTNFNVMVIKDANDSTDTPHNIYIAKWSTLRTIDDLSKFKFDFIILDNRGQMLNNSFCTSMLLKHYERKINILISSVDITSDLKLLHNVLRLGGRLEPQYSSFKTFEEKYKLPDAKELAYKKVDLEEYFCKRERLADYCKNFRLRRYCHQFEASLPLVKEDRYKINLDLWKEKQNMTTSESSSIEYVNQQQRQDEHVKDTQELFEEYCRQRKKQHLKFREEQEKLLQQKEEAALEKLRKENEIIYSIDDEEVASINATPPTVVEQLPPTRDNSDEPVLMSPLLVVSDSEDTEDVPQICNDPNNDIEIVDLSGEEEKEDEHHHHVEETITKEIAAEDKSVKKPVKSRKHCREVDNLSNAEHNFIMDKIKLENTAKRLTRHAKEEEEKSKSKPLARRLIDRGQEKVVEKPKSKEIKPKSSRKQPEKLTDVSSIGKDKTTKNATPPTKTNDNQEKEILNDKTNNNGETIKETKKSSNTNENETTPKNTNSTKATQKSSTDESKEESARGRTSRLATKPATPEKTPDKNTTPLTSRKAKPIEKPLQSSNTTPTQNEEEQNVSIKKEPIEETPLTKRPNLKASSERLRFKRELEITPMGVHNKQTRSMQRLTRSTGTNSKYISKNLSLQIDKIIKPKKKPIDKKEHKTASINKKDNKTTRLVLTNATAKESEPKDTQASIISHRSSQDYESIQCAQRLSGAVFDNNTEKTTTEFLVPPTPPNIMRNSLIPSSAGFFSESEVIFVPPSSTPNVAAKANNNRDHIILLSSSETENSLSQSSSTNLSLTSRRTRALKPRRSIHTPSQNESASLVPTFSELLAQHNTRTSAKSPDLFSNCSDLAQLPCSQPSANTEEPNTPFEGFKIFGSEVKQLQQHYALAKKNSSKQNSNTKKSFRDRSCLDILEKMFEPSAGVGKKPNKTQMDNEKSSATSTKRTARGVATAAASGNKQKSRAPILPSHPIEAIAEAQTQQQQQQLEKRKRLTSSTTAGGGGGGGVQEDEIFEITNNGTFGSVMRLHSNGDISPVQQTQKTNATQHNKITNYLIGSLTQSGGNGSQEDNINNSGGGGGGVGNNQPTEAGTPSKKQLSTIQQQQHVNLRKSPKGKSSSTQSTKLTKWFTKPSETANVVATTATSNKNNKKSSTPIKQVQKQKQQQQQVEEVDLTLTSSAPSSSTPPPGKRTLKRRRLDLAFNK